MSSVPKPPHAALLDQVPLTAQELVYLENLMARTFATTGDVVMMQAEAIAALEAVALSVAGPGVRALNIVTGPYGDGFGQWLRRQGAEVLDLRFEFDSVATAAAVTQAIAEFSPQVLSVVHAEAATGGTNPLPEIIAAARAAGVLTVVDSVAAIGAEPLLVDEWGIDIAVMGGQKSLAGPAGISAASVSARAWDWIDNNPAAPQNSFLSLLDWRELWLRSAKESVPGMPNWLEARGLIAALERVHAEGLDHVIERHHRARTATLAAITALGFRYWQQSEKSYAPVVSAIGYSATHRVENLAPLLVPNRILSPGNGPLAQHLWRVNHYGQFAHLAPLQEAFTALAQELGHDPEHIRHILQLAWDEGQ